MEDEELNDEESVEQEEKPVEQTSQNQTIGGAPNIREDISTRPREQIIKAIISIYAFFCLAGDKVKFMKSYHGTEIENTVMMYVNNVFLPTRAYILNVWKYLSACLTIMQRNIPKSRKLRKHLSRE